MWDVSYTVDDAISYCLRLRMRVRSWELGVGSWVLGVEEQVALRDDLVRARYYGGRLG